MDVGRPKTLWVFGYGSLVWNPGFPHTDVKLGRIRGFARRFWQGNDAQRGTPQRPGRVATLVEDSEEITWGKAFELGDEATAMSSLDYLNTRETKLGGYRTTFAQFEPVNDEDDKNGASNSSFPVLVYVATGENSQYMGPAPLPEIADQISTSRGTCGHNVEYLVRLAEFMRKWIPHAGDEHLFTLEHLVLARLKEKNIPLRTLMGDTEAEAQQPEVRAREEPDVRPPNFQFTASLPPKNLRCLKI